MAMRVTAVFSWVVILSLCVGLPVLHAVSARIEKEKQAASTQTSLSATRPATLPSTGSDVLPLTDAPAKPISLELRFASRYAVGAKLLSGITDPNLLNQLDVQSKSDADRIAVATVAGELEGADAALKRLAQIGSEDARQFEQAYQATPQFPLGALKPHYGFFADLANAHGRQPDDPARRPMEKAAKTAVYAAITLLVIGIGALLLGLVLLVLGIVFLSTGTMRFKVGPPVAPATYYVESFALYLVLLLSGSAFFQYLPATLPVAVRLLPMVGVVLLAAAWPLIRAWGAGPRQGMDLQPALASSSPAPLPPAITFAQAGGPGYAQPIAVVTEMPLSRWQAYCRDIGLHTGTGLFQEIGWGIVGYVAGLPIIGLALLAVLLLSRWAGETTKHPIADSLDTTSIWSLLLLAAVFAPITEELMFRGHFIAHLRRGVGIFLAALISGLIFAAVHPQGWLAIPALATIGGWLAIVRQWRGTLIPSIVIHAINNGAIVLILVNLLR